MKPLRVLVVEDSLTVRKQMVRFLAAEADIEVVAEAPDGPTALALVETLRPDVMTLDLALPGRDGISVTEAIMAHHPLPIVVVSSADNRGELMSTYDALQAGAVDALDKPALDESPEAWGERLRRVVRRAARIRVITHLKGRLRPRPAPVARPSPVAARPGSKEPAAPVRLVAVGASTGGPGAVARLLRGLGPDFPLPVLVVIHVGRPFGLALADWLDSVAPLPVRSVVDPMPLPARGVWVAPPDRHLVVRDRHLELDDGPERHATRPAVDNLFESLVPMAPSVAAALLTGMGRDGAEGLLALRQAGALTLAQDEASSVIHGMPGSALALGAADLALRPEEMAALLRQRVGREEEQA